MADAETAPARHPAHRPQFAALDWDADGVPHSTDFQDRYFSRTGALEESSHVFLDGNRLQTRWRAQRLRTTQEFTIAELGFGSGLNFLNAWRLQLQTAPALRLHYIGLEGWPVQEEQMRRILDACPELAALSRRLLRLWLCPTPGWHHITLNPPAAGDGAPVRLSLLIADAAQGLRMLRRTQPAPAVNAWFLDGFSPARNPHIWSEDVFRSMAELSAAGCTFATYTAAGRVRDALKRSGFHVEKTPGHGAKKDMLCGALKRTPAQQTLIRRRVHQALVIGGGLAGCATAAALAQRGLDVVVLEKHAAPAQEASGQPCSILYPGLSAANTPAARFSLAAWHFAMRSYRELFDQGALRDGEDGAFCGLLHLHCNERLQRRHQKLAALYADCPELLRLADADQAGELSGVAQIHGGLFLPASGWLRAGALCTALLRHPRITLRTGADVRRLQRESGRDWVAQDAQGAELARAELAAVAAGCASAALLPQQDFGLQAIRGQSTLIPATERSARLGAVLCHQGYVSPALGASGDRSHVLGATHEPELPAGGPRTESNRRNLQMLALHAPHLFERLPTESECRGSVGLRCVRRGRAPLAGEVPGAPGLFVNLAHGGRGLCLIPLCAEIAAAAACGETPPVEPELLAYAAPAA